MAARTTLAAAAAALLLATPAQATLLGDLVDFHIDFEDPHTDQIATDVLVVTPQAEFTAGWSGPNAFAFGEITVDVDDSSIWMTIFAGTEDPAIDPAFAPSFELWIEDLHWVGMESYVIDQVIPQQGNTAAISVDQVGDHEVHFSFPGFVVSGFGTTQEAHFDITHRVPEPGLIGLLGAPLGLLVAGRRRRR